MKKILVLFFIFGHESFSQSNKNNVIITSGLTLSNLKSSKFAHATLKLKPIQAMVFVTNYLGVGISTGYVYDKLVVNTTTATKEISSNLFIRGFLNNKSKFQPYLQISSGIGIYKVLLNDKNVNGSNNSNDPFSTNNQNLEANTTNYSPSIGTLIQITKRFGVDFNYEYYINHIKYKNNPNISEAKQQESRVNLAIYFKFGKNKVLK